MAGRSVAAVPRPVLALLAVAFALQIGIQASQPPPVAQAEALPEPATPALLRLATLNEPIAAAQLLTLYLQAFDNQPGISIPFRDLDYPRVIDWLETILGLDAIGQYPLLMASQLYAQVPVEAKQRLMLDFVHSKFLDDPQRRWRWLAHAAIMAKHRLKDNALALQYAEDIARLAPGAPSWARQMRIFILEDMGELESATILLGGLLATGEVSDPREIHFLTQRLEQIKGAEKSAPVSKN
ncbi:MAG: hypothetical protein HY527_20735 [Betaproteobacteria bacterium]|nr:hypothetical protein [Betaproteobacteria bacterium]